MISLPPSEKKVSKLLVTFFLFGLLAGIFVGWITGTFGNSQKNVIADYYETENAVIVSPHSLRKEIAKGSETFVLVDLRSEEEYNQAHIIGALNIPAYKDKDTSDYGAVDRIVNSFRTLQDEYPDKDIIVYCYSLYCMTGRKVGNMLAEQGIYVKHLGIGWNEWRYEWTTWNHEHEWNSTTVQDYISIGSTAGSYKGANKTTSCPINGGFGC